MSVAENLALRTFPRYARAGLLDYRSLEADAATLIAQYQIKTPSPAPRCVFFPEGTCKR